MDFTGTHDLQPDPHRQLPARCRGFAPPAERHRPVHDLPRLPGSFSAGARLHYGATGPSRPADYVQWSSFETFDHLPRTRPDLIQRARGVREHLADYRLGARAAPHRLLGRARRLLLGQVARARRSRSRPSCPTPTAMPSAREAPGNGRARSTWTSRYVTGRERSTEGRNRDDYDGSYKASAVTLRRVLRLRVLKRERKEP